MPKRSFISTMPVPPCFNCRDAMQDIALFVAKRLATLESVLSTATHFILTRYKDGGVVLNPEDERDERRNMICD